MITSPNEQSSQQRVRLDQPSSANQTTRIRTDPTYYSRTTVEKNDAQCDRAYPVSKRVILELDSTDAL
ncbi:MAG: hypothetical protein ABI557_18365, partial [Aureliella sp.]